MFDSQPFYVYENSEWWAKDKFYLNRIFLFNEIMFHANKITVWTILPWIEQCQKIIDIFAAIQSEIEYGNLFNF